MNKQETPEELKEKSFRNIDIIVIILIIAYAAYLASTKGTEAMTNIFTPPYATCVDVAERTIDEYGSFKGYLKTDDIPYQITVDGKTLEVNENLAALDCELVYGDFDDVPFDQQMLVGTEWLYLGYDKDGELMENSYVK